MFLIKPEFDQDVYNPSIYWSMYNILLVTFKEDVAHRVAVYCFRQSHA